MKPSIPRFNCLSNCSFCRMFSLFVKPRTFQF